MTYHLERQGTEAAPKGGWGDEDGKDDNTDFPNAEECLMIFDGPQAYGLNNSEG